jgi:hypothetical protein
VRFLSKKIYIIIVNNNGGKMKKKSLISLAMLSAICFYSLFLYSVPQQTVKQVKKVKPITSMITYFTDVSIYGIYSSQCLYVPEMNAVNAIYMKDLWVYILNYPCPDGKMFRAKVEVIVSYFDLSQSKMVEKKITCSPINAFPTGQYSRRLEITSHPILIKKSQGITVRVLIKNTSPLPGRKYKDCDYSNNTKTIYKCDRPIKIDLP